MGKTTNKQMTVQVAAVTQAGNEVLGTKEKTLHYIVIGEGESKVTIQVGQTNYDNTKKLLEA